MKTERGWLGSFGTYNILSEGPGDGEVELDVTEIKEVKINVSWMCCSDGKVEVYNFQHECLGGATKGGREYKREAR